MAHDLLGLANSSGQRLGACQPAQRNSLLPADTPVMSIIMAASAAPITMSRVSATNRPNAVMVTPRAMKVCRNLSGEAGSRGGSSGG